MSAPTTTEKKPKKTANKKTADLKEQSPSATAIQAKGAAPKAAAAKSKKARLQNQKAWLQNQEGAAAKSKSPVWYTELFET